MQIIENYNKEILILSDYKLEIIKELKYIIESSFLNKLSPIIEEGNKELKNLNGETSFSNPKYLDGKFCYINNKINKEKEDIDTTSSSTSQFLGKKKVGRNPQKKREIIYQLNILKKSKMEK